MSTIASDPGFEISDEVDTVAGQLGIRAEIPAVMEMTRRIFPGADVSIEVEVDPEIANHVLLAIIAKLTGVSHDIAVAANLRWHRELREACPAPLATSFCLGVEFAE